MLRSPPPPFNRNMGFHVSHSWQGAYTPTSGAEAILGTPMGFFFEGVVPPQCSEGIWLHPLAPCNVTRVMSGCCIRPPQTTCEDDASGKDAVERVPEACSHQLELQTLARGCNYIGPGGILLAPQVT